MLKLSNAKIIIKAGCMLILAFNLLQSGDLSAANIMLRDEYRFWVSESDDNRAPVLQGCSPQADAEDVACSSNIKACIFDTQSDIDISSIDMEVNGVAIISSGIAMTYQDIDGSTKYYQAEIIAKTANEYVLMYDPADNFNYEQTVTVTISASDVQGNSLNRSGYSFKVQEFLIGSISSFGGTQPVEVLSGIEMSDAGFKQDNSAAAASADGKNVFIAWEQRSSLGIWDIYCVRSNDFGQSFGSPVKVNPDAAGMEQRSPAIALDSDNNVYISWQQKQPAGDWDIYIAKMDSDQNSFSPSYRIYNDSNATDQISPSIAVGPALRSDGRSWTKEPATVYAAWTEQSGTASRIYYTRSTAAYSDAWNVFVGSCIRLDENRWLQRAQDPVIRLDASSRIFVAWRGQNSNGSSSVYFDRANKTATDGGESFQSDIAVSNGNSAANAPELAVSADGNSVYLLFKELSGSQAGLKMCYYRYAGGAYLLNNSNIVNADNLNESDLGNYALCLDRRGKVSAAWSQAQSGNRIIKMADAAYSGYEFSEFAAIVTAGYQQNPCLAMDALGGHYYLGWTDDSNGFDGLYFCRNTYIVTDEITAQKINNDIGGSITVSSGNISGTAISIPADAVDAPITITIAEAVGAPDAGSGLTRLSPVVDFGPGQTAFNVPAKITLPYNNSSGLDENSLNIFYYNIGALRWESVPNSTADTLNKTISADISHFSMYMVADGVQTAVSSPSAGSGGGGGGGCFIATAAFGTGMDEDVYILRRFRDEYLLTNNTGAKFVRNYYKYSPAFADKLKQDDNARALVRACLRPLIWVSRRICD